MGPVRDDLSDRPHFGAPHGPDSQQLGQRRGRRGDNVGDPVCARYEAVQQAGGCRRRASRAARELVRHVCAGSARQAHMPSWWCRSRLRQISRGVTQVPKPLSPTYRNRVPKLSLTYRSHSVKHEPELHTTTLEVTGGLWRTTASSVTRRDAVTVEATPGIEPGYRALQNQCSPSIIAAHGPRDDRLKRRLGASEARDDRPSRSLAARRGRFDRPTPPYSKPSRGARSRWWTARP